MLKSLFKQFSRHCLCTIIPTGLFIDTSLLTLILGLEIFFLPQKTCRKDGENNAKYTHPPEIAFEIMRWGSCRMRARLPIFKFSSSKWGSHVSIWEPWQPHDYKMNEPEISQSKVCSKVMYNADVETTISSKWMDPDLWMELHTLKQFSVNFLLKTRRSSI